ncbi:hypothetical protein [Kitasatospora sp. NPDC005856]
MTPANDPDPRRKRPAWPGPRALAARALLGAATSVGSLPLTLLAHWLTTR